MMTEGRVYGRAETGNVIEFSRYNPKPRDVSDFRLKTWPLRNPISAWRGWDGRGLLGHAEQPGTAGCHQGSCFGFGAGSGAAAAVRAGGTGGVGAESSQHYFYLRRGPREFNCLH